MMRISPSGTDIQPIDIEKLEQRIPDLHRLYHSARPWPHVVIDEFLEHDVAVRISESFPPIGKMKATLARTLEARSYGAHIDAEALAIKSVFAALHGNRFTALLEAITGVASMAPDKLLVGAGLHQGARGSYLRIHADHNTHPSDAKRFRRINIMIYLNSIWQHDWNGALELWDREASKCLKRIEPTFNRCAILCVDDTAFHGYGPLRVPPNTTRKALAAYYYSDEAAAGQKLASHPTTMPPLRHESQLSAATHRIRRAVLYRIEKGLTRLDRRRL